MWEFVAVFLSLQVIYRFSLQMIHTSEMQVKKKAAAAREKKKNHLAKWSQFNEFIKCREILQVMFMVATSVGTS